MNDNVHVQRSLTLALSGADGDSEKVWRMEEVVKLKPQ